MSYQLNSTANPAHLPQNWAPRILIFSIVLGAEYSFYLKFIATYAPAFLGYNDSALARVALRHQVLTRLQTRNNVPL